MEKPESKFIKVQSDGSIQDAYPLPNDHPTLQLLFEHIANIERQNKLLCKIVGPKITAQIKKGVLPK